MASSLRVLPPMSADTSTRDKGYIVQANYHVTPFSHLRILNDTDNVDGRVAQPSVGTSTVWVPHPSRVFVFAKGGRQSDRTMGWVPRAAFVRGGNILTASPVSQD